MIKKCFFPVYLSFILLLGCASDLETFHSTRSLGEQLEDLDKAYKSEAITEDEYKKAKQILIEKMK